MKLPSVSGIAFGLAGAGESTSIAVGWASELLRRAGVGVGDWRSGSWPSARLLLWLIKRGRARVGRTTLGRNTRKEEKIVGWARTWGDVKHRRACDSALDPRPLPASALNYVCPHVRPNFTD